MYYVMYGDWGECWGEYESFNEAKEICDKFHARGEDAWICED